MTAGSLCTKDTYDVVGIFKIAEPDNPETCSLLRSETFTVCHSAVVRVLSLPELVFEVNVKFPVDVLVLYVGCFDVEVLVAPELTLVTFAEYVTEGALLLVLPPLSLTRRFVAVESFIVIGVAA